MIETPLSGCSALELAKKFHETYERLAPLYGYQTRPVTREFDPDSPNGRLMVAVCQEILSGGTRQEPMEGNSTKKTVGMRTCMKEGFLRVRDDPHDTGKFRTCVRKFGHNGRHMAYYCGRRMYWK